MPRTPTEMRINVPCPEFLNLVQVYELMGWVEMQNLGNTPDDVGQFVIWAYPDRIIVSHYGWIADIPVSQEEAITTLQGLVHEIER